MSLRILSNIFRKIIGGIIAKQRFRRTKHEKYGFPLSLQCNADVDKAKHKPFRHAAVKSSRRKKADRKQQKQQHSNRRSPPIDTFFLNADFYDQRNTNQAYR